MANSSGKIKVTVSVIPLEIVAASNQSTVSAQFTDFHIKSHECPTMSAGFDTESIEYEETGSLSIGYQSGDKFYAEVTTTSNNVLTTGLTYVEFVYFKHTGYEYNYFTDATCDTDDTSGSGTTFGDNPTIIRMDDTSNVVIGMIVSGTGITGTANVTQIDSSTLFRIDANVASDQTNTTLTFNDTHNPSPTANTTDHLEIRGGDDRGFVIAVLAPYQAIALPVQCGGLNWTSAEDRVGTTDYFFRSVNPASLVTGSNTIAMELICVTAS